MNLRIIGGSVLALAFIISVLAVAWTAPTPTTPGPTAFGTGEGDLSAWKEHAIQQGYEVQTILSDPTLVQETPTPSMTLLVIPRPTAVVDDATKDAWNGHLDSGGTLLILDGTAASNGFLFAHGLVVADRSIMDPTSDDVFTVRSSQPDATSTSSEPIHAFSPAALVIQEGAEEDWQVLLRTSPESVLDIDQNQRIDRSDIPGPHTVAARLQTPTGGELLVMSSVTFLANHYYDDEASGNQYDLLDLITTNLPPGATIIIDESHHGWTFPENQLVGAAKAFSLPAAAIPWVMGAVITTAAAALVVALKMSAVDRYTPHQLAKTAIEPHHLDHTDGFFAAMAAEIRSRSGADTSPLSDGDSRSKGDWLEQAAKGNLRPEDRVRLIQLYESEVNQHA